MCLSATTPVGSVDMSKIFVRRVGQATLIYSCSVWVIILLAKTPAHQATLLMVMMTYIVPLATHPVKLAPTMVLLAT